MSIELAVDRVDYYAVTALPSYTNATAGRVQYFAVEARDTPRLIFFDREGSGNSFETVPQTFLPAESVQISDGETETELTKAFDTSKDDEALPADSDPIFDVDKVLTDSVNAVEAKVFVFTDFIDFDPSDADVDPDPVTMAEADTKAIDKVATDTATASEAIVNNPDIAKTDSVAASDAVDTFDVNKAATDTATASEAIDRFDVTTEFDDTVTATEALAKDFTQVSTDDVTAVQSNVKTFTSNVDFDLSDADVDPDPVTASDAVNSFATTKGLTDTATATEADAKEVTLADIADNDATSVADSDAKDFTHGGFSDSLTAVEGIKNNPDIAKTETVTASEAVNLFDVRPAYSDTASPTDAVDDFDIQLTKTDTVNVTDVSVKNFTQDVDFDTSDADADADPVTMAESLAANPSKPLSDSVSPVEAQVFEFTNVYTDTATATESINTTLTLGDLTFLYPDFVAVSDGYIGGFIEEPYSYTISSTEYFVPNTGVIGAAETLNTVIMAADRVTAPDESSSGLVVNFHYTDVDEDDRALGGYQFNQTPLNPGNSTVGQRAIL
tara:strand:+ start:9175 stop:10845 length:1671 start_codon:yes stop_codon:yes gene_type:complete